MSDRPRGGWLRLVLRFLKPYRRRVVGAVALLLIRNLPSLGMPVVTAVAIDAIAQGLPPIHVVTPVAIGLLLLVLAVPAQLFAVRLYSRAYRSMASDLRHAVTDHQQALSIGAHSRRSPSALQTKVIRDVENIEQLLQQVLPATVLGVLLVVGSVVITAVQVPAFLLVFAVVVPVAVILVQRMRRGLEGRNSVFRREVERLASVVGDMTHLTIVTRAHGLERVAAARVKERAEHVKWAGIGLDRFNAALEISWLTVFNALTLISLALAGVAALTGLVEITPGQVVLLSSFCASLAGGALLIAGLTPLIARGAESARSIQELLDDPDLEDNFGKRAVDSFAGLVEIENVGFRHPGANRAAITDLDLVLRPGEVTALVGSSGSGKSTAMNLVLGFVRPESGRILFDGADMRDLDMRTLRRFFAVVPQEPVLVGGSIRDNVAYGIESVGDDRLRAALETANAGDFVRDLGGWDAPVGERGSRLSGGQRQRLAIARAVLRDPMLLLLDEATSALDGESEALVRDALQQLMRGRTSLVIAHRMSTIRSADQIVVLEDGCIREIGRHEELLAARGRYAELHNAQLH